MHQLRVVTSIILWPSLGVGWLKVQRLLSNRFALSRPLFADWRGPLRRFLSSLTPEVRHRDVANRLTQGTGRWFLERPELQNWLSREGDGSRVLCCVGDPGAGKTGLAYVSYYVFGSFLKQQ